MSETSVPLQSPRPIVRLDIQKPDKLEQIRERMYRPTSRADLSYMLDGRASIVSYTDLPNYATIEELLDPYQAVILLYPSANDPEVGHWVTFFVMPGTDFIQYFDSYGCEVDEPIVEYNEEKRAEEEGEAPRNPGTIRQPQRIPTHLIDLILASKYADNMAWNETPFQSDTEATATCGLWCVARLKNNHLGEDGFRKLYWGTAEAINVAPDLLVSAVITNLFPELGDRAPALVTADPL